MRTEQSYDLFEIDWFNEFLAAYQVADVIVPTQAAIERYRGRLPDHLLEFWRDHGWCSWSNGQYWLCDPQLPQPLIESVFEGDPEFDPNGMLAFGYTAFGEIDIWMQDTLVRLDLPTALVRTDPRGQDDESGRLLTDEIMLGLRFSGRFAPITPPREDACQRNLMPQALERLGSLAWGEIYGFVPAVTMGGQSDIANLRKMPLIEHLAFLASIQKPILYDYEAPERGSHGLGNVKPIRRIG